MSIFLIRHGETELNATRVVQHPETPLGDNGLDQARRVAKRMSSFDIGRVICSDYARAHTTAEHIAAETKADMLVLELLRERNFGELRGQSYDSLTGVDIFARDYHPPAGESWAEFDRRVDSAWSEIIEHANSSAERIAVVTHGLVLKSLFDRHLDLNGHIIDDELVVGNTSVTEVSASAPWQVQMLACVAHLESSSNSGGAV